MRRQRVQSSEIRGLAWYVAPPALELSYWHLQCYHLSPGLCCIGDLAAYADYYARFDVATHSGFFEGQNELRCLAIELSFDHLRYRLVGQEKSHHLDTEW